MAKIGIIGDSFIDRYWVGEVKGLSAEAAIPKVEALEKLEFPGGAANVRENFRSLGMDARMLFPPLEREQNYPIKNRLVAGGVQLARWDENDWCEPFQLQDLLALVGFDALVVSDYCKGAVSGEVIQVLREANRPLFVDTKGDPKDWLGAEDVTVFPNRAEYHQFKESYNWFEKCVLKCGESGIAQLRFGKVVEYHPALAKRVVSVCGAGDTVLAAYATLALSGANPRTCLEWASKAAAVVVEKPYTACATVEEIYSWAGN